MDEIARQHISLNHHRKRKPDTDDPDASAPDAVVSPDALLVDTSVPSCGPSNAPRQPWLASDAGNDVWPPSATSSSDSPLEVSYPTQSSEPSASLSQVPYPSPSLNRAKRPRLEKSHPPVGVPLRRSPRRHASSGRLSILHSSTPPRRPRRVGGGVQDTGVVSRKNPGPTSGSLLRVAKTLSLPCVPIDPNSPHIPSAQPLINRQTLKELDLEAILRNPQLRHDLLFDPGLQFRPTSSRRKREMSENYWAAIIRELESGCTCVSFDLHGKPHDLVCACGQVSLPTLNPILAFSSSLHVLTLRMPSRIRPLLSEFLEVLLSVIQPLSSLSGMYVNPNTFQSQMQEHAAQAAYVRSLFDPDLIEQELKHELFDPSGLFQSIGHTLKSHCAPMRDRAVEAMVMIAQSCAPGRGGSKADAVKAVRICMDILELMKLDIANHQLQTLRPFLIRTSGQFELKTFRARKRNGASLQITQDWLRAAHREMLACKHPISHPLHPNNPISYNKLQRNQQAYLATLRALTDLVFNPPSTAADSTPPPPPPPPPPPLLTTPPLQNGLPIISALPGYPETSYLDNTRLLVLSAYAADATTLYMFLLLYRQLVFSELNGQPHATPKVEESELIKLKKEIRDIGGCCLSREKVSDGADISGPKQDGREGDKWINIKQDIILQIAMRAKEAQNRVKSRTPISPLDERSAIGQAPDERMLRLAERWAESNMQPGSPLNVLLRTRLRDAVFEAVVAFTYPPRDSMSTKLSAIDFGSLGISASINQSSLGTASGMEPLAEEIQSLAERLSRLALIHLNAYIPLYEQDGFLES